VDGKKLFLALKMQEMEATETEMGGLELGGRGSGWRWQTMILMY
jgi:hypothetical protein